MPSIGVLSAPCISTYQVKISLTNTDKIKAFVPYYL